MLCFGGSRRCVLEVLDSFWYWLMLLFSSSFWLFLHLRCVCRGCHSKWCCCRCLHAARTGLDTISAEDALSKQAWTGTGDRPWTGIGDRPWANAFLREPDYLYAHRFTSASAYASEKCQYVVHTINSICTGTCAHTHMHTNLYTSKECKLATRLSICFFNLTANQ